MPNTRRTNQTTRAGCLKGIVSGCFAIIFIFILIIFLLSSLDLPEINFDLNSEKSLKYNIQMDSLSTEKIISASYSWKFVNHLLKKKKYNISFSLIASQVNNAMDLIDKIGNMTFEELGLNPHYNYSDPQVQAEFVWTRIYQIVYRKSFSTIFSIVDGFNQIFKNENLNAIDKVAFVISFVQYMKYDRPGGTLDLFAPLGTLAKKYGDCDTKALLLYVILERMGIDCAMMWSYKYKHAMLGINVSARGDYKKIYGKKYYFLETTYPGWAIGVLPPEFSNKRFWFINEIDSNNYLKEDERNTQYNNSKKESDRRSKPSPAIP